MIVRATNQSRLTGNGDLADGGNINGGLSFSEVSILSYDGSSRIEFTVSLMLASKFFALEKLRATTPSLS